MTKGNGEYKNGKDHPDFQPVPEAGIAEQLTVTLNTLSKLGSIAVHARGILAGQGLDAEALRALLSDPEVDQLLQELAGHALISAK